MRNKQQNIARDAAIHHTTLNTFASVVSWADGAKRELYKLTLPKIGTKP